MQTDTQVHNAKVVADQRIERELSNVAAAALTVLTRTVAQNRNDDDTDRAVANAIALILMKMPNVEPYKVSQHLARFS